MGSNICRICKRKLKKPISVELGIGSVCRKKEIAREDDKKQFKLFDNFKTDICPDKQNGKKPKNKGK
jgi:hypothetical protein